MDILSLTAVELAKAIREGKTTSVEATQAVLDKIAASEDTYHCYVTVEREKALQQAAGVQKKIEAGELTGPLAGVPFAIKDNMCTEGTLTTCSSKILENFVPTFSAEAVLNLEKAGAVILGKTNMDEFAMGSTTETSYYGVTKNPRNPEHVPGGSSGGSAAAVAAEECFAALGSDTGGSIRQPASYCGVVGMKPTYGTVSRYGLIAYGSSLDQIGPLTKDVTDCATVLEAITSHDPKDSTSMKRENTDFTSALVADVKEVENRYSQRLFRGRTGSRGQGCGTGSSGSVESAGGRSGGVRLKSGRLCDPHLLYDRGCRGKFQSRAFRRCKIRLPCTGCGGPAHHVQEKSFAGLWTRGEASYHAGLLCIKLRLL